MEDGEWITSRRSLRVLEGCVEDTSHGKAPLMIPPAETSPSENPGINPREELGAGPREIPEINPREIPGVNEIQQILKESGEFIQKGRGKFRHESLGNRIGELHGTNQESEPTL
jgi:hypothetical protein